MNKFIELTCAGSNRKIFIAVNHILAVMPEDDETYIELRSDRSGKGSFGYLVAEGYEQVKCKLTGVFDGYGE